MNTLLQRLDQTPPFVCYYLARDSKGRLDHPTAEQISKRSKATGFPISERTVTRLSQAITWADIRLSVIDAFVFACGEQFVKPAIKKKAPFKAGASYELPYLVQPHRKYLYQLARNKLRRPLYHLNALQRKRFDLLCSRWVAAQKKTLTASR